MQQFVFVGSQGSFNVPLGESRIGSDAACQICIRGEGVLPVHAYLRSDGERLLIRPVEGGTSSSGYASGAILVNGSQLSGPISLSGGQEIAIGGVQMRVLASGVKRPPLWRRLWDKTWFRRCAWATASFAALVVLAYCVLIYVILHEGTLKEQIRQSISNHLLRDDAEIESVSVNPFEGVLKIKNLKLRDRENFAHSSTEKDRDRMADGQAPFISIPSATVKVEVWPLIRSWFREYRSLSVEVRDPLINIERAKSDGALNVGDIVQKYSQSRSRIVLPMEKLGGTLSITGGKIRLVDNFTNIGETSLEEINIQVHQVAEGQPLVIDKWEMKVNADPAPPKLAKGELKLSGNMNLIDAGCMIDTALISSDDLQLEMKAFDLARIFEHLGYSWSPYRSNFKVVLGKPVNGHLDLKIKDPKNIRIAGKVQSESLLSIKEENMPPIGNIPMGLDFDILLSDNGRGFVPNRIQHFNLRSGTDLNDASSIHLLFYAEGGTNPNGTRDYTVNLECILQDLLGTDVGRRLNLAGRLGGRLQGNARFIRESTGSWKIDANMEGKDTYVMVSDSADAAKPPVRQPLPVNFEYHASAQPNAAGIITELVLDRFNLKAPSFEASSEVPGMIKLDQKGELEAQAQFKLALRGKQFWNEFKPILDLFGFKQPIEEVFDMKITAVGSNDIVKVVAKGNAARQWDPDPAPVELETYIEFNRKAAGKSGAPGTPYLAMMLEVASNEAKPLYIRIDGHRSRDDKSDTFTLERVTRAEGEEGPQPGLVIKSDVTTLRERFRPYVEGYLESYDAENKSSWLKRYRETRLTGAIEQSGRMAFRQMLDPQSKQPDIFDFDLRVAGKALAVQMPVRPLLTDDPAKARQFIWSWNENSTTFDLKGQFRHRVSENKEEPDRERLDIERLDVKGSVGTFQLALKDLDIFKLLHLRNLPKQTWTDCVAALSISGQIDPPAYEFARSLQVLPLNNPISGGLSLQIAYDREKDSLDLQKFVFKQHEKKPNAFLMNVDAVGSLLRLRELSARLLPVAEDAPPLAENLETFLSEGGPAVLLDHLGDDLTLNSLQMDADSFLEWLRQDYKDGRQPPAFLASILRGDFKPSGAWKAVGVRFSRNDPRVRKWQLVGAFRNDFALFGPPPATGPRPVTFSFGHEWALRMGIAVSQNDNTVAIEVDEAIFDKADIFAALPQLKYDYIKPSGEPCKVEIAQCLYSHGLLAQIGRLKLSGKPVAVEVKDFDANWTRVKSGSYQVAELIINGGPMPCAVIIGKYEPGSDALHARISAPTADLMYLTSVRRLPPPLQATGQLKNLAASYKGSLIALQALMEPDAAAFARRFPNIDPKDPRLAGLNPESDAIEFDATLKDVVLTAAAGNGERMAIKPAGQVRFTSRDLTWKNFAAQIEHATAKGAVTQAFSSSNMLVNSSDPKSSLLKAYRAVGMPVNVNADVTFTTPVNVGALLAVNDMLFESLDGAPASPPDRERRFAALQNFVFSGSFKAPSLSLGTTMLPPVDTQNITFKNLKLSIPTLPVDVAGGRLLLSDFDLDLTRAGLVREKEQLAIKGVGFRTGVKLTGAELPKLLGGAGKGAYGIVGRIDGQGLLEGNGFVGTERLSWKGAVKLNVTNCGFAAPSVSWTPRDPVAPWMSSFQELGPELFKAFVKASGSETVNIQDLAKDLPGDPALKPASGLLLALQLYLGRACGVEVERFEFEPLTPTIVVDKGQASIDPFQLIGRGACNGLELQVRNVKVNLADEAFADETMVYSVALPQAAKDRLYLSRWPAPDQAQFNRDMTEGKMPMRIYGRLSAPTVKYPWPELKALGTNALFGRPVIHDLQSLYDGRLYFMDKWPTEPDIKAAALVADRFGVGLPATVTSRNQGYSVIDRVPGLPQSLVTKLSVTGPTISPYESLNALLNPEPDAQAETVPVPPVPPNRTPAPKSDPK